MTASSLDPAQKTTRQRTVLLATDRNQSVLAEITDGKHTAIAYSSYGKQSAQQPIATALGFNGQLRESRIGWYLLGNGYRAYNPVLMRFHSPDSWSPFGRGGLNAYMYCVGDPVNRVDPTGHSIWSAFKLGIQENVSWGNSMESMRARTIARRANGIERQEKMYAIGHSPKNQDLLVRPTGSVTGALFGAGVNAGLPPNYARGSPPSPNSPHVHPNGVAPTHPSSSYGIVYPGVPTSGPLTGSGGHGATMLPQAGRPRASSFDEPRVLYNGPPPKSPRIEHLILLGGAPSTVNRKLVDRTNPSWHVPLLLEYRNAGALPESNGWQRDYYRGSYANVQIRMTRCEESNVLMFNSRHHRRKST